MTVPKLRFPEFLEAGKWVEKPIAKICDVLNSRRMPISSNNREKGSYPYYGASGIVDYVNNYIFDDRLLLIGEDGAKWGAFEKSAFIAEGKYWVNNHAHVLKATSINDTLLENYLNMLDLTPYITGAAPPKLTLGKLKEIPAYKCRFFHPPSAAQIASVRPLISGKLGHPSGRPGLRGRS